MYFGFSLLQTDRSSRARLGEITTPHGEIATPAFAPVGTQATVKALDPRDLHELGAELILSNTYHLYLRPGADVVARAGRAAPVHGVGRPDPDRLGRLPGV